MPERMSVRGGGWEGERDQRGVCVCVCVCESESPETMPENRHSRCIKRRVPPSYITRTQHSALSAQHNHMEEQRAQGGTRKQTRACLKSLHKNPLLKLVWTGKCLYTHNVGLDIFEGHWLDIKQHLQCI